MTEPAASITAGMPARSQTTKMAAIETSSFAKGTSMLQKKKFASTTEIKKHLIETWGNFYAAIQLGNRAGLVEQINPKSKFQTR